MSARRRLWLVWIAATLTISVGVGLYVVFHSPGEPAPPVRLLTLGAGMTDLASHPVFDSGTADQGGPRQFFLNVLVEGARGIQPRALLRREVMVLQRHHWTYIGTIGGPGYEAILVPAGSARSESYAFDRSRQVCATLTSARVIDPVLTPLAARHRGRALLWVQLFHDVGEVECRLATQGLNP